MEGETPTLFTQDDTGNYVEYTPPEPPAFHETLPEDIRESEHLKEVKDGAELARYYVDLKTNELRPPDTPDGYEFEPIEGFNPNEEALNEMKQWAHEQGITQKQFNEMIKREHSVMQRFYESVDKHHAAKQEKAEKELKAEWGDQYEAKIEKAKSVLNHPNLKIDGFSDFLEKSRFGDSPHVIKLFAALGEMISEDAFGKPGSGDDGVSKQRRDEAGRPMLRYNMK